MGLAKKIAKLRKTKKMTSKNLSEAIGVSRSYISLIETGRRLPSKRLLAKLAKTLDVNEEELVEIYLKEIRKKIMT